MTPIVAPTAKCCAAMPKKMNASTTLAEYSFGEMNRNRVSVCECAISVLANFTHYTMRCDALRCRVLALAWPKTARLGDAITGEHHHQHQRQHQRQQLRLRFSRVQVMQVQGQKLCINYNYFCICLTRQ